MNDIGENGEGHNFEKAFPGCLGRMVNLFELNERTSKNQLLAYKPYLDGPPLSKSSSDVPRLSVLGDRKEDKLIMSDFRYLNRKSNGTPMKMLLDQEMSRELNFRCGPPNIVAKLMGLETLPIQETDLSVQRIRAEGHIRSHSDVPMSGWEQQNGFSQSVSPNEFKDIYEVLDTLPSTGRYDVPTNEHRMGLVRQKLAKAKCLSMDEKLRQVKQFEDALEVLNTNLQCVQDPTSTFLQDLRNLQAIPPPPGTNRITVLKPSNMAGNDKMARTVIKDGKPRKKGVFSMLIGMEKSQMFSSPSESLKNHENPSQPTRIVVLKPIPVKSLDIKAVGSPRSDSSRGINGEQFFEDAVNYDNRESKEVVKIMAQQMREKLGKHYKDEASISSAFSDCCIDDENSSNKSEIEYGTGLSESEAMSPTSRHSWDYVKMRGVPYSSSSFSGVHYSPESSVCKEAKKRLSERWAMMALSRSSVEQKHTARSSSTLGEMLALSETKKVAVPTEVNKLKEKNSNSVAEQASTPETVNNSPRNLMRSKSVPISSNMYGVKLDTDVSLPDEGIPEIPKEAIKGKQVKSSLKGKVTSLFFSRNKKASKVNSLSSETEDELQSKTFHGQIGSHGKAGFGDEPKDYDCTLPEPSNKASFSNQCGKTGMLSPNTGFSEKHETSGNASENLNQPSPISVLDRPFEADQRSAKAFSYYLKPEVEGFESPENIIRSNSIDKSPPIGSVSRTLSWDDSSADLVSSFSTPGTDAEEQEWLFYVETLLSSVDLQGEMELTTFLAKWHSSESPLDPSLRDKYIDSEDKELMHESSWRQTRSTQKLVFDRVNASLVEIGGHDSFYGLRAANPCVKSSNKILENNTPFSVLDEVWTRMSSLLSGGVKCVVDDCGDDLNSLVLERVVRKEVVGNWWMDHLGMVTHNIGDEIGDMLLEELVYENVVELN